MSSFAKKISVIVLNTVALFVFAFAPSTFSFQFKGDKYYSTKSTVLQELSYYAEKGHYNRAYPGGVLIGYLIILAFLVVIVAYIMALSNKRPQKLTDQVLQVLPTAPLALIMLMLMVGAIPIKYSEYVQYVMKPGFAGFLVVALCIAALVIMLVIPVMESAQFGGTIATIPNKVHVAETKVDEPIVATPTPKDDMTWADTLLKYKALLDEGVITEEDFNKKKKELMGL